MRATDPTDPDYDPNAHFARPGYDGPKAAYVMGRVVRVVSRKDGLVLVKTDHGKECAALYEREGHNPVDVGERVEIRQKGAALSARRAP